jgi:hypothetical protein
MKYLVAIWLLCAIISPRIADAQKGAFELGVDRTFDYQISTFSFDERWFLLASPTPGLGVRIGIFASKKLSIEPALAVQMFSVNAGEFRFTIMDAQLGLLYHLFADPEDTRLYLRVAPVVTHISVTNNSAFQFGVSVAGGAKFPVARGLTLSFAAGVQRGLDTKIISRTMLLGRLGVSFFVNK